MQERTKEEVKKFGPKESNMSILPIPKNQERKGHQRRSSTRTLSFRRKCVKCDEFGLCHEIEWRGQTNASNEPYALEIRRCSVYGSNV